MSRVARAFQIMRRTAPAVKAPIREKSSNGTFRSPRLRNAARGRPCVLCDATGTTVAAHSNSIEHGHGKNHKAPDYFIAYVCQGCHDLIDGRSGGLSKAAKREMWERAFARTVALWFEEGIVK